MTSKVQAQEVVTVATYCNTGGEHERRGPFSGRLSPPAPSHHTYTHTHTFAICH